MSPSSTIRDFAQYAGRFLWPRSTADLTDTTLCPACRAALSSPVCAACGLDLRHPAAVDLLAVSTDAAAALDKRVQLIGQIRHEVAEAATLAEAAAQKRTLDQAAARATLAADARRAAAQAEAERAAARAQAAAAARITASPAAAPAAQTVAAPAPAAPVAPTSAQSTTAEAAAPAGTTPPATIQPAAAAWTRPTPAPLAAAGPTSAPPTAAPTAAAPPAGRPPTDPAGPIEPAGRKRSSVQIVLLLVGVTLVSVAAIFFLTVAWIFTGLAFRSSVVAVFTLGTLVTAALLRRKRLVATAEGIGALAVVLVLLDAWALRQNNLFGLGERDGLLYWGGALAVCTVLFLIWHALSSLRVASVAGFAAAAPAVGLLAAGIAADAAPLTRVFVAVTGAAAGALLHRFTVPGSARFWPALDRRAERIALLSVAGLALLTAAGLASVVQPDSVWTPLVTFGVVAVLASAHALTVLTLPRPDAFSRAAAYAAVGLAALAGVLGVVVCAWRSDSTNLLVSVPLLVAVAVALAFELAWRRLAAGAPRRAALSGALTAAALVSFLGLSVLFAAAVPLIRALLGFDIDPIARTSSEAGLALAALVGTAVLVGVFWRVGGVLAARRHLLVWFGLVVVLVAVPFTQWLWLILPLYLLLGALALAALFLARAQRPALSVFRPQLVTLLVAAEALGYVLGWSGSSSWWLGTLSAVVVLVLARLLLDRQTRAGARGALLSGAIVFTLIGVAAAPRALTLAAPPTAAVLWLYLVLAVALTTGVLQLIVAQGRFGGLTPMERRWAFWTLLAPTLYVVAAPTGRLVETLPAAAQSTALPFAAAAGILATVLVAIAVLLWTLLPAPRLRWERLAATLLVAPALLALAVNLVLVTDAPASVTALAAPTATLLTVALALALRVTGRTSRAGLGLEIGAAVVLATAFLPLGRVELGWLVLLLTAVAVLLSAVDADGLFASGSWRRHLGWASLGLATAGLWWGLADSGTTPVEAYVLPVAGTVLALAALLWRYGRVDRAVAASPGAALLTLAGLSLALLPLALTGQSGSVLRPILVAAASTVLLLGATLVRWTPPRWAFLAAAGLAGAVGLTVTVAARSLRLLGAGGTVGALLEAWLLPTTLILVTAAILLVRQDHARTRAIRQRAGLVLVLVALTGLTVLEAAAFGTTGLGAARAIGLVVLLGVVHVLGLRRPRAPFGLITAWSSAALAGAAATAALVVGAVEPFEAVLVPLGLALVAGQLLLNRPWSPGAGRSASAAHYWIGAGLTLALLPSAAVAAAPGASTLGAAGLSDDAARQLFTLALGGGLAVAGAVLLSRPRWSLIAWPGVLVGSIAVVVTAAGRIQSVLAAAPAGPDGRLEGWLVPAALLLVLVGGLVIRVFPAPPRRVSTEPSTATSTVAPDAAPAAAADAGNTAGRSFGYGLVVLALLGILGAETAALSHPPYASGRALALIGLFSALHVVLRWRDRSRAGGLLAWFTMAAGILALVAGTGRDLISPLEWGTVPLGVSLVVGQLLAARLIGPASGDRAVTTPPRTALWLGAGLALALLPSVVAGRDGELLRPLLTLTAGGLLVLGGALLLSHPRWTPLAWPAAIVGAVAVVLTAAGRIQPLLATTPTGPDGRLEAWLLPAALLLIGAGGLVIVRGPAPAIRAAAAPGLTPPGLTARTTDYGEPRRVLGYGLVLLALAGILAAEIAALPFAPYAEGRLIALIALFAVLHLFVRWVDRSSAGAVLAWFAIAAGLVALVQGRQLHLPTPLELGTIPLGLSLVAGALVTLGLLGGRSTRTVAGGERIHAAAPSPLVEQTIVAVGLAVAILPSVVAGTEGTLLRPALSLVFGGAIGILGALALARARWRILAWPACGVGSLAVLATAALQIVPLYSATPGPTGQLEVWLIPAAALLVATGACLVWAGATAKSAAGPGSHAADSAGATTSSVGSVGAGAPSRELATDRTVWAGYALVIAALVGVVLAEISALGYAPLATIRVVLVVWTFSALYLGAFWADPSRRGRLVAWVAIGGAAGMVVAGWAQDVPDPVEIITIPLALALVASGLLHLDRTPAARSWAALAPGLLVLLVPSLLLDLSYSPLWRVVGLGVLAIAVLLIGTARKLQAPFLIGAVVLLIHGVAQLWPWISLTYDAVPWWLWLGVGGVLLIVLAARYEQRIQNLKSVALRVSALR